jgi:hypothetical protein
MLLQITLRQDLVFVFKERDKNEPLIVGDGE